MKAKRPAFNAPEVMFCVEVIDEAVPFVFCGVIAVVPGEVELREVQCLGVAQRAGYFIALESGEVVAFDGGHSSESPASPLRVLAADGSNSAEIAEVIAYRQRISRRSICGQRQEDQREEYAYERQDRIVLLVPDR